MFSYCRDQLSDWTSGSLAPQEVNYIWHREIRQNPASRHVTGSSGETTAIDWVSDVPALALLTCVFTIIGYYPCPSGHFPICFYPFPHSCFVIEGEKKHPQDLPTAVWLMRAHDSSGSQLSWRTVGHLCHPSKARGPLCKKGAERM